MKRPIDPDHKLLHGASDPTRLAILRQLAECESVCACDFTSCCDVGQPTVSHHLKVLRESGWVDAERRGSFIYYRLRPEAAVRFAELARQIAAPFALPASVTHSTERALPVLQ
jgi:ArsR family transcriptional regulator